MNRDIMRCHYPLGNGHTYLTTGHSLKPDWITWKKFYRDDKYKKDYTTYMKEILERGDVEEVREDELPGEQWYITHQGVDHPKKPDKLRLLWLLCKVCKCVPSRDGYDKQPHWFPLTVQMASDSSHVWYREYVCQSTCDSCGGKT